MGNLLVRVPHQNAYVVEFLGRYQRTLSPGFYLLIPGLQRVAYRHSLKEHSFVIGDQRAVTKDNVHLQIDGVLYLKIEDPYKCSYGAQDPLHYTYVLAQSLMRSEIGKLTLDETFEERERLNNAILEKIVTATEDWGITCFRHEIKDIRISENLRKVMNLEAESERQKRAEIIISEGKKKAEINLGEAYKRSKILLAEAQSEKLLLKSRAMSERIRLIGETGQAQTGNDALRFNIADLYVQALEGLTTDEKNIILQSNLHHPEEILTKSYALLNTPLSGTSKKASDAPL
eukprot:TRINITY_DN5727_c0_g1_i1.p1 TRINITY_DN5727_c0_g1~~TRINITY_DN5727_c0_g1_i1.p1  ORF type:complete len:289 (+),score=59.12 TRINITY_DN5727_c0_g1_i1:124-990(+)